MPILIITHSRDNESVELVARALEQRGERAYRLDTDLYPTEVRLSLTEDENQDENDGAGLGRIDGPAGPLDLAAVTAVWYRRSSIGTGIPADLDPQLRRPSVEESRRMIFGMLAALEVPTVDPLEVVRRAEHKPLQLRLARRLGLAVPRTLSTNDPEAVRAFARSVGSASGGIITKMMASFAVHQDGVENVVFTNPVSDADLADLEGLDLCPMTFQERIDKALELRVTVVGRQVFAASIDSQASPRARHDWRRDGAAMVADWRRYELPAEVAARTLALMDRLDLTYGACDFIVTPDGRHVFLEVNPSGEFMWLVRHAGLPIAEAIADVLAGRAPRR